MIKMHEHTLNDVYKLNQIKVRNEQIRFKVVNVVFQDDIYCSSNSREGWCESWVCI